VVVIATYLRLNALQAAAGDVPPGFKEHGVGGDWQAGDVPPGFKEHGVGGDWQEVSETGIAAKALENLAV
jgi:hypothetical protein